MAQGNAKDYLKSSRVKWKKYFYVLRPILACKWIEQDSGVVPMEFDILLDRLVKQGALRKAIDELLKKKLAGEEMDEGPRIAAIHSFVESELKRLDGKFSAKKPRKPDIESLNKLFRASLDEVWGKR